MRRPPTVLGSSPRAAEGGRTLTSLTASKVKASAAKRVSKRLYSDAHQTGNSAAGGARVLSRCCRPATHSQQCTQQCRSINRCGRPRIFRLAVFSAARRKLERELSSECHANMLRPHLHICLYIWSRARRERRTPVLTFDCGSYFRRPIGREPLAGAHKKSSRTYTAAIKLVLLGILIVCFIYIQSACMWVKYTRTVLVWPGRAGEVLRDLNNEGSLPGGHAVALE